jgi:hypothetical protein
MNELSLTEKETLTLKKEIESKITYRKKQVRNFSLFIIGGILLSLTIVYWKNGNLTLRMILAHIIIGVFMLIPMTFAYYLSQRTINKLKNDLGNGKKITGVDKVKSINFFNRTIILLNGIKVYETNAMHKQFKKGDLIKYSISPSNQYQFECIKG